MYVWQLNLGKKKKKKKAVLGRHKKKKNSLFTGDCFCHVATKLFLNAPSRLKTPYQWPWMKCKYFVLVVL